MSDVSTQNNVTHQAVPVDKPIYWDDVRALSQVFFPQYFDTSSPAYVDPIMLDNLQWIAEDARPWCLPIPKQNFAQAMFLSYLIQVQKETSSGQSVMPVAGPITSEKEGDIAITYAAPSIGQNESLSKRPSSDPWDAWNRLWSLCQKGSITTRFGDPCQQQLSTVTMGSKELSWTLSNYVVGLSR